MGQLMCVRAGIGAAVGRCPAARCALIPGKKSKVHLSAKYVLS